MPHWKRCASEDAAVQCRPRGVTKFLDAPTGICTLCGRALGKRFTRELRKIHEASDQHVTAHERYTAEFTRLVEQRLIAQWEQAQRETVRRQDADVAAYDLVADREMVDATEKLDGSMIVAFVLM